MSSTLSPNAKPAVRSSSQTEIAVVALASNPECAHAAKRAGAARIYVPALNYRRGMAEIQGRAIFDAGQTSYPKHCVLVMPVVSHDAEGASREAKCGMDAWESITAANDLVVQGIGDMQRAAQLGARFEIGSHIPLVNSYAMEAAAAFGAVRVWLSPELNLAQIQDLAKHCSLPLGIKVFGSQELMTTEHCMLASQGPCIEDCVTCARRTESHYLKDRKGYEFPVVSDALGRSHIYNSVKLDATPELSQLVSAGVTFFMVDTTLMNAEEAAQAVGYCVHALRRAQEGEDGTGGAEAKGGKKGEGPSLMSSHKRMSNSTSGHLHRGVL